MDLGYLLWLEGVREALPEWVEEFFVIISAIANSKALVIIPCLLFWCLDKRAGRYLVFTFSLGVVLNQFLKSTVCCYRPWIRSAELNPSPGALEEATGYSFPSGHTENATALIGGFGWYYRKRWRWLAVLCWVFVVLVGFSRNFLGVHTPQDVIVGLLEGILMLFLVRRLLDWVDAGEGRDVRVVAILLALGCAFVAYTALKPYPMDYDASGALLVDPKEMVLDNYKAAGAFLGAVLGWFLERRFVGFVTDPHAQGWKRLLVRIVVGFAVVGLVHVAARLLALTGMGTDWYELLKNFVTIVAAMYVAPLVFSFVEKRVFKDASAAPVQPQA